MMELGLISIIYAFVIIHILFILMYFTKPRTGVFPSGPRGWPFLGHAHYFNENCVRQMQQFHSQYGKTFYLKMASHHVIVCADIDLVKKYFTRDVFQSRPETSIFNAFTNPGLLHYNGQEWRIAKRFALKALKSIGFGRSSSEKFIHREVDHFLAAIDERRKSGAIHITELTGPAASNVVSLFVTGQRFDYDDKTRKMLDSVFLRPSEGKDERAIYFSFFNFIRSGRLLTMFKSVQRFRSLQQVSKRFIAEQVMKISSQFNPTDEPSNFIEMYLKEVHDNQDNPDFDKTFFDTKRLIRSCYSFFVAGSATTQEYLEWWFLLVANNPRVQEKMRTEVDRVVGGDRATLAHRLQMPYTESVIHEVHRYASLVALNLPHIASEDTEFGPYFLPQGTQVIINMHQIHHDPEYFPEPNEFRPERFLSEDGTKFTRSDKVIPFGHGKRSCAGESLAQAEIFIFTVSTVQKYQFRPKVEFDGEIYTSVVANLPRTAASIIFEPR